MGVWSCNCIRPALRRNMGMSGQHPRPGHFTPGRGPRLNRKPRGPQSQSGVFARIPAPDSPDGSLDPNQYRKL